MKIHNKKIGPGHPVYIIAEMSANHLNDFNRATRILRAAKKAGADAVKLQTYTADTMTIASDKPYFKIKGTLWEGRHLYDLYQAASTPWAWQEKLMAIAHDIGIDLFSTPFDETAVDFLETLKVPAYKVASFEIVHFPLLRKIAQTGKPVILSTGMASMKEISEAIHVLREAGGKDIGLLKCTSAYPAPLSDVNLNTIPHMIDEFKLPVGLSDHTLGSLAAVGAVAKGASVIEKHLTLSRADGGPDGEFSLEPDEFNEMVNQLRAMESALGNVTYGVTARQKESLVFRRSIFAVRDIPEGKPFSSRNIRVIRPGHGLHPKHYDRILHKKACFDIQRGTPLDWPMICE